MASTSRPYPELSLIGVGLGAIQGVVMTASFVYIALKLGFGLSGSTVAAILGFVILRGALRRRLGCTLGLVDWADRQPAFLLRNPFCKIAPGTKFAGRRLGVRFGAGLDARLGWLIGLVGSQHCY